MKKISIITITLFLSACASNNVIIDTKGVDLEQYNVDVYECEQYQNQVSNTDGVAVSAVAGALVGAVIGAAVGNSDSAAEAATVLSIEAGVIKANQNDHEQVVIMKNCLSQRGYRVLN